MNKSDNNKKATRFSLQKNENDSFTQQHKDLLGLDKPENYFAKSKSTILEALHTIEVPERKIFGLSTKFAYPIAASLIFIIGMAFWFQFANTETNNSLIYNTVPTDEILISSLLVAETDVDLFIDNYIFNDIIVATEYSEQALENIFINSLFIEDASIDSYIDSNLIDNILL